MTDQPSRIQKAVQVVREDVLPKSQEHTARIVLGGLAFAAAVYQFVIHKGAWERNDLIAVLSFAGLGVLIVFTKTALAAIRALTPWKKNGESH